MSHYSYLSLLVLSKADLLFTYLCNPVLVKHSSPSRVHTVPYYLKYYSIQFQILDTNTELYCGIFISDFKLSIKGIFIQILTLREHRYFTMCQLLVKLKRQICCGKLLIIFCISPILYMYSLTPCQPCQKHKLI